jgi:hypothetical protein
VYTPPIDARVYRRERRAARNPLIVARFQAPTKAGSMFFIPTKLLRAALLATAVAAIPAFVGSFTASAQDWQHHPILPVPNNQAGMAAGRSMLESLGGIRSFEATFSGAADQLQRLAQNDPTFRNVKFDVRQMALRLLKERKEEFITEAARIHATYFTVEEMQRLAVFFGSPLGGRFQLLTQAFAANHNIDRQKARQEAAISIGLAPAEKAEIDAYVRTPDFQKFLRFHPIIVAGVKDIGTQWATKIAKEILDAAIRERSSQSAIPARN